MPKAKSKETRGRKPKFGRPFDDRAMFRCFRHENLAWVEAAKTLTRRLGRPVSLAEFVRLATNEMASAIKRRKLIVAIPKRAPVRKAKRVRRVVVQPTEIIVENSLSDSKPIC